MRRVTTLLTGAALAGGISLLGAPAALADGGVACDAYAKTCPAVPGTQVRGGATTTGLPGAVTTRTSTPASLPFTGGDVVLLSLAGSAAIAGGAALVMAGRRRGVTTA